VQVRPGHASSRSNQTDLLTTRNRVTFGDERATQMEVPSYDAGTMVDVDYIPRQKEPIDERHDTTICRTHGRTDLAGEIDAEMPARQRSVERPP